MLGLVAVPRDRILRATQAVGATLRGEAEFHVYGSLCGLLEHLRAVNLLEKNVMHGLYAPHGPEGASRDGPTSRVFCDYLMRKQLTRWLSLLGASCGANVKMAIDRRELRLHPSVYFHMCSDAMYEHTRAAMGGFCHGSYWTFEAPREHIPALSIPILEFLGVFFNVLVFSPTMKRLLSGNPNVAIVLRTDALTAALTLRAESQQRLLLVRAYQWLRDRPEFSELSPACLVAHLYGDANPYSDALSRGKWKELFQRVPTNQCQAYGNSAAPRHPRSLRSCGSSSECEWL